MDLALVEFFQSAHLCARLEGNVLQERLGQTGKVAEARLRLGAVEGGWERAGRGLAAGQGRSGPTACGGCRGGTGSAAAFTASAATTAARSRALLTC